MPSDSVFQESEQKAVRIPPNRLQKLNQFLRRLLMTAVAYFLCVLLAGSPSLPLLLGVLLLTFFASSSIFSFLSLLLAHATTALRADAEGITDATGPIPGGLVYWHEISSIVEGSVEEEPILLLNLYNPQAYLDRLPESTRLRLTGSVPVYGTPCVVAQTDIGIPIAEARQRLEEARQRFAPVPQTVNVPVQTAPSAHWWTAIPPEERKAQPLRNGSEDR